VRRGQLAFTLAGHLPILCWRAATSAVEDLVVAHVPLGILPGRWPPLALTAPRTTIRV
jgi:serine phosphatase RsbU (regulator of sigma subunit)